MIDTGSQPSVVYFKFKLTNCIEEKTFLETLD